MGTGRGREGGGRGKGEGVLIIREGVVSAGVLISWQDASDTKNYVEKKRGACNFLIAKLAYFSYL